MAMESAANGIQTYEDCAKTNVDNLAEWIEMNTSQLTQECLSLAVQASAQFVQAIHDKSAEELALGVSKLDTLAQHCMLE